MPSWPVQMEFVNRQYQGYTTYTLYRTPSVQVAGSPTTIYCLIDTDIDCTD